MLPSAGVGWGGILSIDLKLVIELVLWFGGAVWHTVYHPDLKMHPQIVNRLADQSDESLDPHHHERFSQKGPDRSL